MKVLREYILEMLLLDNKQNEHILVPPPPSLDSRIEELVDIQAQYHNPYSPIALMQLLDEDMVSLFNIIIESAGYDNHKALIEKLKTEVKPVIKFHKTYFNAPRPIELAKSVGVELDADDLESARSPSYPSGHSTQAYYIAAHLSKLFPSLQAQFNELANMIAESRVDRGVHFRSDIEAGKLLADQLIVLSSNSRI